MVKRFNTYKDDEYINGIPTFYICNKRLTAGEISVFALLIITFILLILITAFEIYSSSISHTFAQTILESTVCDRSKHHK